MSNKIEQRLCKYVFDEDEKRQIASDLANGVADIQRLEDQKKSVMSQLKSEIDAKQGRVNLAAEHLRSGFEMRSIDCEVVYAYSDDEVRWVRLDTLEVVHSRRMRPEERQRRLDEFQAEGKSLAEALPAALMDAAENGALEGLRPKKDGDIKSVTIRAAGRSVTLEAEK